MTREDEFRERGWLVLDLPDPEPVWSVREALFSQLPGLSRLEDYHGWVGDDEAHIETLHRLSEFFWDRQLGPGIVAQPANLEFFRRFVGLDLHIQRYPYLRAVRPGRARDAVPLHRDTYYGASPYELSVVVPFTDMGSAAALRVISGSHVEPDESYPYTQTRNPEVEIGSSRHQLGYAYAPRLLSPELDERAEAICVRPGQALLFSLALVHGGGTNSGTATRFSTDIRLVNSLAPVNFSRGVRTDYFVPLCSSALTATARRYLESNQP